MQFTTTESAFLTETSQMSSHMNTRLNYFRSKHSRFVYKSYDVQFRNGTIVFSFEFHITPDLTFRPVIEIDGIKPEAYSIIPKDNLNNLAFNLGLVEIPSYWKATCSPEIVVMAGSLDRNQIDWWKNLIMKGMGEFFYVNQINYRDPAFVTITVINDKRIPTHFPFEDKLPQDRILVPVSGGKDSIVTINVLENYAHSYEIGCLTLNPTSAAIKTIQKSNCNEQITVTRKIDNNLLSLNSDGYLNGHTPFSSVLDFISISCALIFNYGKVILSNERSSNEGNTVYMGEVINHQYSKSIEFENLLREYVSKYIAKNLEIFSLLRPLYEIQIAEYFSKLKDYHSIFLSCNRGQKEGKWCRRCPKCLSTFLLLSPFLEEKELIDIFSEDLFSNSTLTETALSLISLNKNKPFECVGTYEENLICFYINIKRRNPDKLPIILRSVKSHIPNEVFAENQADLLLKSWNNENNLPDEFVQMLKKAMIES